MSNAAATKRARKTSTPKVLNPAAVSQVNAYRNVADADAEVVRVEKALVDATLNARTSRRLRLIETHDAIKAKAYTRQDLVDALGADRAAGKPMPEEFDYKSNSDVGYAECLGELFSLPVSADGNDDLPADVVIGNMHNVLKRVNLTPARKIIRKPGQTIAGAWAEIVAADCADSDGDEEKTKTADPEKLLKAAAGAFGKAHKILVEDPSKQTEVARAQLATFAAQIREMNDAYNALLLKLGESAPTADGDASVPAQRESAAA